MDEVISSSRTKSSVLLTICFIQYTRLYQGCQNCPNQPTKQKTKGGDLRKGQIDVPWSGWAVLRVTTSLGSITNT